MILDIFLLAVLILCNAFFSAAEAALISLKPVTLEQLSKTGKRGRTLSGLAKDTSSFLATVQIGVTLAGFLASAFAADTFSDPVAHWIYHDLNFTALSEAVIDHISVVVITLLLSYFSLVFGELVPKQIALRYTSFVALNSAIPIHWLLRIASPLVWLLNNSVKLVMLPFGSAENSDKVTEEEIRSLINMGEKDGLIDADERRIIQNVFELNDITCGEIMTRRGAVCAIEAGAPAEEVERLLLEKGFSAYPVYRGSIDRVIGILYAADYYRIKLKTGQSPLPVAVMRMSHFVPEGATVQKVLHDMQRGQFEIAIVLDGRPAGGTRRLAPSPETGGIADPRVRNELGMRRAGPRRRGRTRTGPQTAGGRTPGHRGRTAAGGTGRSPETGRRRGSRRTAFHRAGGGGTPHHPCPHRVAGHENGRRRRGLTVLRFPSEAPVPCRAGEARRFSFLPFFSAKR